MRVAVIVIPCLVIVAILSSGAAAEEKYSFHEKVRVGEVIPEAMTVQSHFHTVTTEGNEAVKSDIESTQTLNGVATVLTVTDGSATAIRVAVDADSQDTEKDKGGALTKTPCSYAGQTVTLRRRDDQSVASDFHGKVDPLDEEHLDGMLDPDQDFYPDHPVAAGESWDISDKLSVHSELGPQDKLQARCRLDWVKEIGGKKMAQITCSCGTIRYGSDNVEEDIESNSTMLVDMAAGAIVKADQTGKSTFSTPQTEPRQVTGGCEFTFHGEVTVAAPATLPATRP